MFTVDDKDKRTGKKDVVAPLIDCNPKRPTVECSSKRRHIKTKPQQRKISHLSTKKARTQKTPNDNNIYKRSIFSHNRADVMETEEVNPYITQGKIVEATSQVSSKYVCNE
jgi:hypothetical protein